MPWKNCAECGRSYNAEKGGCTNSECPRSKVAAPSATPVKGQAPTSTAQTLPTVPKASSPTFVTTSAVTTSALLFPALGKTAKTPASVIESFTKTPPTHSDTPIIPWIETASTSSPISPKGIPLNAKPFKLTLYRGEKSAWWPPPNMRLAAGGMAVFEPWVCATMGELWEKLRSEVMKRPGFNPASKAKDYAQYLRAEGRDFALATARTKSGAFGGYSYVIEIENARTFLWGKNCTIGPPADFLNTGKTQYEKIVNGNKETFSTDTITADYIVLNADRVEDSTILAFGHKTGTYEVTVVHTLPIEFVKSCNGVASSAIGILTKQQVTALPDSKEKLTALKLFQ